MRSLRSRLLWEVMSDEMPELLPCPFCGKLPRGASTHFSVVARFGVVECTTDGCLMKRKAASWLAWNTRAPNVHLLNTPEERVQNDAENEHIRGNAWQPMKTAPRDKTHVLVQTFEGFAFPAFYDPNSSLDENMQTCGVHKGFHPPCWSEGACWTSNADQERSDPPVAWKPLIE